MNNTTILIVDDHPAYSEGVARILQDLNKGIEILTAKTAQEALQLAAERIDIEWIILDYQLPDIDGINLLKRFNEMLISAPIVMISGNDDIALIAEAIELGACGFIHKASSTKVYENCLSTIESGELFLMPELKASLDHYRETVLKSKRRVEEQLSERRKDVLILISEGYSNAEIAQALSITQSTVKSHVSALMELLDADNRSHCVAEAQKLRLIK